MKSYQSICHTLDGIQKQISFRISGSLAGMIPSFIHSRGRPQSNNAFINSYRSLISAFPSVLTRLLRPYSQIVHAHSFCRSLLTFVKCSVTHYFSLFNVSFLCEIIGRRCLGSNQHYFKSTSTLIPFKIVPSENFYNIREGNCYFSSVLDSHRAFIDKCNLIHYIVYNEWWLSNQWKCKK